MTGGPDRGIDLFVEQLPAYALEALEPDEVDAVDAHLPTCATCRGELERFRVAVAALAVSPELAEAPAGHEARFAQKLAASAAPAATPVIAPRREPAVPARSWWEHWNPFAGWAVAAALAIVLLVVGLSARDAQQQATGAQAERNALAQILANPASQATALKGQVGGQDVQAQLWVDPATQQAVLVAGNLPAPPAGKVYELWLIQGQNPVPINIVPTDGAGRGLLLFKVPGALTSYQVAAITIEPGRVDKPTSAPVIAGTI